MGANATGIRGERANLIIVDEYGDVPKMIIDTVVIPFASVQEDPVNRAKMEARIDRYKRLGKWTKEMEEATRGMFSVNQVIVAGTAKIYFNHFAQEYEKRKKIIQSRGDKKKLAKVVDKKSLETLNPAHYSIMRIPYDLVPKGFLSRETIDSMRESLNRDTFHQEFGAIFTKDTNGFYRAALIYQMCTANDSIVYNGKLITEPFDARVKGDPEKRYVMAIDPAKKRDLAAIVILELGETHNKVVYCWTSNEEDFLELKKKYGNDNLGSYYQFIAAKILELTKRFNIEVISCDYQGGGDEIMGILQHDKAVLGDDIPLYPICDGHPLWDGKERDTDDLPGRHIIEPVQPSNATYTSISHHALLADMEKLRLIYPTYDAVSESIFALEKDEDMDGDSIKKALLEIQEMKYELTIIEYTQSDNGRERWDTPEIKSEENKKGRMVNDRMSALVMANYAARRMMDKLPELEYNPSFTYVGQKKKNVEQDWISIPQWASKQKDNVGVIRILGNKE